MTSLLRSQGLDSGFLFVVLLSGPIAGCGASGDGDTDRYDPSPVARKRITQSSPVWAKLAVIQSGLPQPPADMLVRFERAFNRLEMHCPDAPDLIGEFIVAGQRELSERGKRNSLLELTEAVATMLDTATQSGGILKMNSCAEPVALMVTGLLAQ